MQDRRTPESRAPHASEPESRQGFLNAPWWRLLLWTVIFIAVLVLLEELQTLG